MHENPANQVTICLAKTESFRFATRDENNEAIEMMTNVCKPPPEKITEEPEPAEKSGNSVPPQPQAGTNTKLFCCCYARKYGNIFDAEF